LVAQESRQGLQLEAAKSDDILKALMSTGVIKSDTQLAINTEKPVLMLGNEQVKIKQSNANDIKSEKLNNLPTLPVSLNEQYYLNSESGYVVQITGFSDLSRLKAFVNSNNDLEYYSYQRILNNQKFFVLTSKVFNDKVQAREAINQLPEAVKNLGSFLKSVSTIKREINTVSQ
jgi:hypothetical protein